jgi:hypothetical protein
VALTRIISGGQTGADQGGLLAGKDLGLATGGWAPKGWRTQAGPNPDLGTIFGLREHASAFYPERTGLNVLDADGTVLFARRLTPGSALTVKYCVQHQKPCIINPSRAAFRAWLAADQIAVLNVAGNSELNDPGIAARVRQFLVEALRDVL